MEEELKERERNMTMPKLTDVPLKDDKINIDQIKNVRATEILYQSVKKDEDFTLEKLPDDTSNYDKSIKIILIGDSNVGKTSIFQLLNNNQYNNYQRKSLGLQHYNYFIKINNVTIRMQIWDTVGQEKFDSLTLNYYKNTDVAIFVYAINDLNSFNKIEQWDTQLSNTQIINDKNNEQNNENEINNNIIINNEQNNENEINNNININNEQKVEKNKDLIKVLLGNKKDLENKDLIKVLLGNKKDLENERKVTYEQGEELAKNKKFEIFREISCNSEIEENGENKNIEEIIDLFDNIGKKVYIDFVKDDRGRLNSASYCYQATNSILYSNENGNNDSKNDNKSSSCCGCMII